MTVFSMGVRPGGLRGQLIKLFCKGAFHAGHFVMRQVLIDEVRRHRAQKRQAPVLTEWPSGEAEESVNFDLENFDQVLTRLQEADPERARRADAAALHVRADVGAPAGGRRGRGDLARGAELRAFPSLRPMGAPCSGLRES